MDNKHHATSLGQALEKDQAETGAVEQVARRVLAFSVPSADTTSIQPAKDTDAAACGHTFQLSPATYDQVIVEAPLQIVLSWYCPLSKNYQTNPLLVTMRTPGDDEHLVKGLLLAADIIKTLADIECLEDHEAHQVDVTLAKGVAPNWDKLARQNMSMASCGLCGVKQIKQLALSQPVVSDSKSDWLAPDTIASMPKQLKAKQSYFAQTGGVHGAGLWCAQGSRLIAVAEDVGRHNAVDKVIGKKLQLQQGDQEMADQFVLVLSGRISFELVQKAIMANIPVIVAIGAPTSLAIKLAHQFNITLIGFTQANQCNVYCKELRIQ